MSVWRDDHRRVDIGHPENDAMAADVARLRAVATEIAGDGGCAINLLVNALAVEILEESATGMVAANFEQAKTLLGIMHLDNVDLAGGRQ